MPLQYSNDDGSIAQAFSQLGDSLISGPKRALEAQHIQEQIAASRQARSQAQQEFDAKMAIADHQANMERLTDAKAAAGVNWGPDQEQELLMARRRLGQAATKASAFGGKTTSEGIWSSVGQSDIQARPPRPGTPEYLRDYAQTAGKLPDPTKEEKTPFTMVFQDPNNPGRQISRVTHDGRTDVYTNRPISEGIPAGWVAVATGSPVTLRTGIYGSKEQNAGDLQAANQQLLSGQQLSEPIASIAQKYFDANPTKHQLTDDKFGGKIAVGMTSEAPNPGLEAVHQHLAQNYYNKGGTTKPAAAAATAPAAGAAPAPAQQQGGNILFSPQGLGGASSTVQTQTIPASQAPTSPLPGSSAAAAAPTTQPGAPGAQPAAAGLSRLPDGRAIWRPSPAPAIGQTTQAGPLSIMQATRGYSEPMAQEFSNSDVGKGWRVADEAYNEMQRAAKYDSKASDLHMIYTLAKIFDPGSAVREGELVLGQGTASPANWLVGWFNQVKGGGRLTDGVKNDLLDQAYTAATSRYEAGVNLAKTINDRIVKTGSLDPQAHLPEMVQPAKHDPREINRFPGSQAFTGKGVGDSAANDQAELVKLAGNVQGGAPGQTSTSVAGQPPAVAPRPSSARSGQAPVAAPAAAAPAQTGAPNPIQQLLNDADAITGRKRAQ
jgi:hypothetical protein